MRQFFRPAAAPPWLNDVLNSIRGALSDEWPTPLKLAQFTAANVPPAADWSGGMIYVLDEAGGAVPAYSDGTSWRRVTDRTAITAWSPATLFSGALAGAWYKPSLTSAYTSTDTSVPVSADGDTIGRLDDLSGNGNHLTQATAGDRPTFKTSAGKSWILNSTGAKSLVSAAMGAAITSPFSFAAAGIIDTLASSKGSGAHNIFVAGTLGGAGGSRLGQYESDDKAFVYNGSDISGGSALTTGTPYVLVANFNGASTTVRVNGSQFTGNPGANSFDTVILGAPYGSAGLTGKLYEAIIRDDPFTADEIASIEAYLTLGF